MSKGTKFLVVAGSVLVVALAGASLAFAQAATPSDGEGPNGHGFGMRERIPGAGREAMTATIAEALGITEADLEAARAEGKTPQELAEELGVDWAEVQTTLQAARAEVLAQAVADGNITQEQADNMLNREGWRSGLGDGHYFPLGNSGEGGRWVEMKATIAEALGITEADLEAARAEGKTPQELAEELGVDWAEVQTTLQAARAEVLAQAVADGNITQEQADNMLNRQGSRPGAGN